MLTHTASTLATNYYYLVEVVRVSGGWQQCDGRSMPAGRWLRRCFTRWNLKRARRGVRFSWTSRNLPAVPLPPFYAGKSLAEMLTNTPPVTNAVNFTPSAATNLDDSPELRRHPILDSFVASMGNDPIALANYVINNIDLTDPMDYSDNGNIAEQAINPGGVSRGRAGNLHGKARLGGRSMRVAGLSAAAGGRARPSMNLRRAMGCRFWMRG